MGNHSDTLPISSNNSEDPIMIVGVKETEEQLSNKDQKLLKGLIRTYDNPEETFEFLRLYRKASAHVRLLLNHYATGLVTNEDSD